MERPRAHRAADEQARSRRALPSPRMVCQLFEDRKTEEIDQFLNQRRFRSLYDHM